MEPAGAAAVRPFGLTILVPNWNHRLFLGRSLGSALAALRLLAGRGVPAELVVVDDASRDGSQRTLSAVAARHRGLAVRIVCLPRNVGLPAARNRGLVAARYRYALMMDADNEVIPDNLPTLLAAMAETGAALGYGNVIVTRDGEAVTLLSNDTVTGPTEPSLYEHNFVEAFCLLDVPAVLSLGGYSDDPRVLAHEDWELVLHLAAEGRPIVFVPLVLGRLHREPESMIEAAPKVAGAVRRMYSQRRQAIELVYGGFRWHHPALAR
jgi:glycosyltransferase involved in cell wall biosynthesis